MCIDAVEGGFWFVRFEAFGVEKLHMSFELHCECVLRRKALVAVILKFAG